MYSARPRVVRESSSTRNSSGSEEKRSSTLTMSGCSRQFVLYSTLTSHDAPPSKVMVQSFQYWTDTLLLNLISLLPSRNSTSSPSTKALNSTNSSW